MGGSVGRTSRLSASWKMVAAGELALVLGGIEVRDRVDDVELDLGTEVLHAS